ncbi:MAG: hypothetical protein JOZ08_21900 [Verrucomicrobia bacterium]|nr:hypothetical protein [Verrucomicrobiota bacterium]
MKILSLNLTILFLSLGSGLAQNVASPNGQYSLTGGTAARVVEHGAAIFTVVDDMQGVKHLDVSWSPDSSRVVVAVDFVRGSYIYAAYLQDGKWQRALEVDPQSIYDDLTKQVGASGRVVKDLRAPGNWLDNRRLTVNGKLTFSSQQQVAFSYTLTFTDAPTQVSRGGFNEGAIKGEDFRIH